MCVCVCGNRKVKQHPGCGCGTTRRRPLPTSICAPGSTRQRHDVGHVWSRLHIWPRRCFRVCAHPVQVERVLSARAKTGNVDELAETVGMVLTDGKGLLAMTLLTKVVLAMSTHVDLQRMKMDENVGAHVRALVKFSDAVDSCLAVQSSDFDLPEFPLMNNVLQSLPKLVREANDCRVGAKERVLKHMTASLEKCYKSLRADIPEGWQELQSDSYPPSDTIREEIKNKIFKNKGGAGGNARYAMQAIVSVVVGLGGRWQALGCA